MTYQHKPNMDHTHPDAFVDWPVMQPAHGYTKPCPVCKCHGGWNLQLNAYSLHHYPDTPENRHRYSHFRATCGHCHGWGYVRPENTCPGHEWVHVRNTDRCLAEYQCKHCNVVAEFDSSD